MRVHVLLFNAGTDSEGIHSLEIGGRTVVLMFENPEDAERYAGLLEAQDFPAPSVEAVERSEMETFCRQEGYEARFVDARFRPENPEDRFLVAPPAANRDVENWQEETAPREGGTDLDAVRRRLEGLL
jgi:hypothetical protein